MSSVNHIVQLMLIKVEQKRLNLLVTLLFLVMSAWVAGKMIWAFKDPISVTAWSPTSSTTSAPINDKSIDTQHLQQSHLFGRYQEQSKPAPIKQEVKEAPKSRLNVLLVGVVQSSDPEKSLAVISRQNKQATYGVGEVIEGTRAKVKFVYADRVIVENQGRDETVMLNGDTYRAQQSTQTRSPAQAQVSRGADGKLEKIKQELSSNPQQLFQYVRMSQVKRDNEILGYRLSAGREPELFRSVGLEEGDIATHINGQPLSDPSAMNEIFRTISSLTEINLTVERRGQPYEIYIEL